MWDVQVRKKAVKSFDQLPKGVKNSFLTLLKDLVVSGPHVNWPNFGKLRGQKNIFHCHIKKGKPTYVAIWEVKDKKIKIMEVIYVGTHEKASY